MELPDAIRRTMKRKGWNADRLAEEAKLARSTVFRVLGGRDADLRTLRNLRQVGVKHPLTNAA